MNVNSVFAASPFFEDRISVATLLLARDVSALGGVPLREASRPCAKRRRLIEERRLAPR
jgi:hypothetical protein